MTAAIVALHVVVSVVLILVILLQAGKGGGMGAAMGGGGSGSVFGARGAQTFLGKVTGICAGLFMLTSVTLAFFSSKSKSIVKPKSAPTAPAQKNEQPVPPAPASGDASKPVESSDKPAAPP